MTSGADVATVSSPSSCDRLELILHHSARTRPLLGAVLAVRVPFDGGDSEVCLGTITTIETVNTLADPRSALASHIAAGVDEVTRHDQDTRRVVVKVEAVFRGREGAWRRWSSTLSNSPATGTRVKVLDQELANELMVDIADTSGYVGYLRGADDVLIPITLDDYSGPRGARHSGVIGATGSGKTSYATYFIATMMRHPHMAQLVFDPQSQFSGEHGLPISLQGVAAALGRKVTVARISESLRLQKDAPLFLQLLQESGFFRRLAFGAGADDNIAAAREVLTSALNRERDLHSACGTTDWTEADSATLMRFLLQQLYDILPTGTVYAGKDQQARVAATLHRPTESPNGDPIAAEALNRLPFGALDDGGTDRFQELLETFGTLHQLWGLYNPAGLREIANGATPETLGDEYRRRSAWGLIADAVRPADDRPAPLLILDLSAGDTSDRAADILDDPSLKARIMRQLVATTKRVGQAEFKKGRLLDVNWVIDEAWAWIGPPDPRTQPEAIVSLSNEMAACARDVRKFGIGICAITQSATSIRDDVWRQMSVIFAGYGLHDNADLTRLSNRMSEAHVALYKATPPPEATGRYVFTCLGGGVTGLSFGANPVVLEAFTDPRDWLAANTSWITALRARFLHCLPAGDTGGPLTALPARPAAGDAVSAAHTGHLDTRTRRVAADTLAAFTPPTPAGGPAAAVTGGRWATTTAVDDDPPPF